MPHVTLLAAVAVLILGGSVGIWMCMKASSVRVYRVGAWVATAAVVMAAVVYAVVTAVLLLMHGWHDTTPRRPPM